MPILPPWIEEPARKLAQSFIESGLRRGLSGRDILEALREAGLGYRTQEFYRDVRWWQNIIESGSPMKYIAKELKIPTHWYLPTPADWGARYVTRYLIEVFNRLTGETETRPVWVKHDEPLSRRELEEIIEESQGPPGVEKYFPEPFEVRPLYPLYGLQSVPIE